MKLASPLKYHGGKSYLSSWIISHFPEHTHYVEPFFGGGSVLFHKSQDLIEGHSEVVNDLNGELMNFWSVLASPVQLEKLKRIIEAAPFSEMTFNQAMSNVETLAETFTPDRIPSGIETIKRAAWFFIMNRQSRQGLMKDFATMSRTRTRRGMNEQVSSWLTAIDGLPEIHARLKRVVIYNKSAIELIRQQDGPNTLFYCDPPYLHETRVTNNDYQFEMTFHDHEDLLETLANIDGKFILSGYRSELYDQWEHDWDFRCVEKQIDNKASSKKTKDIKTECLWMNF